MSTTLQLKLSDAREFVEKQKKLGNYKASVAANSIAALAQIQTVGVDLTIGEVLNDIDDLLLRYQNLNPQVSASSLASYRARIKRVLTDFESSRTKAGWKPGRGVEASEPKRVAPDSKPVDVKTVPSAALRYVLPLRPSFDVELSLPRDLTRAEAQRLSRYLENLAEFSDDKGGQEKEEA